MQTLTIIVPCYNEEAVIETCYTRLKATLDSLSLKSQVIFINDGSRDETYSILTAIAKRDSRVILINFSRNFGHQAAVTAGIHHCQTDFAIIIDADLQDPPELIPDLLECREREQANVVYCVRKSRTGESRFKLWSSKIFYRELNRLSEVKFPLDTGDFRLIDSKIIQEFNRFKERGKYIRGLISWVGFKQVPFFYEREARYAGKTKYPLKRMLSFASKALFYFSKKPLLMAISLGFVAVIVGILMAFWYIFGKIFGYTNAESGWTSIMIAIIFFGGIQLLTIGVLGQYIGILFDEVKERPEYIIEEIVNNPVKISVKS
ncbi:MAG: glycosyltransferase family 2 protein [Dysgonamonadaceae bacterium]|jgi:dolichol-phosphate mannosyltransferase|nr:glycosyltransferase family 2 protein [Dysgonamonadaceae bacterium]